jgi:hypothetical protein
MCVYLEDACDTTIQTFVPGALRPGELYRSTRITLLESGADEMLSKLLQFNDKESTRAPPFLSVPGLNAAGVL